MVELYDSERRQLAEEYHGYQERNRWIRRIVQLAFWFIFLGFSLEFDLYHLVTDWVNNRELKLILFLISFSLIYSGLSWILSFFLSYRLNRKYELSTQDPLDWFLDQIKSYILNLIFLYLAARVFLVMINIWPKMWWLPYSIAGSIFVLVITFIMPKVLLPLFFKLNSYPETPLKERLKELVERAGVKVEEIYEINLSSKVSFGNAAVIGLGQTRKIILGDTLTDNYTNAEIEAILAHEIGHQVHGDIFKNLLIQPCILLVTSFIISRVWPFFIDWKGYTAPDSIYALPLLLLIGGILSWFLSPLQVYLNRKFEREADRYSLELIADPRSLATGLAKLADESLSKLYYNFYKLLFEASHPPIGERVERAWNWGKED